MKNWNEEEFEDLIKQRRNMSRLNQRLWEICMAATILVLISLIFIHSSSIVLQGANALGRRCIPPAVVKEHGERASDLKIAMVSFLDEESNGEVAVSYTGLRWPVMKSSRSFEGLMSLVKTNKQTYATKWGYDFIDARSCIDRSRPASWSKIPSVRSHLHGYDWVFWNDADSLVTNPNIRLERILQHATTVMDSNLNDKNEQHPDLIITEDVNGINAGMFFVRRSEWSEGFLDTWWNMSSFILHGSKKSGDNAALIHLINSLSPSEKLQNVHVAHMQCIFNSYPWVPTWKNFFRLILFPCAFWKGTYSNGDFIVHLAGLDDKAKWAAKILLETNHPFSISSPTLQNENLSYLCLYLWALYLFFKAVWVMGLRCHRWTRTTYPNASGGPPACEQASKSN